MRTIHSLQMLGVIPFMKLQKDTGPWVKGWKMRCRTKILTCSWLSCVVFVSSAWRNQESVPLSESFCNSVRRARVWWCVKDLDCFKLRISFQVARPYWTSFWMTMLTAGWKVGVATSFWMTVLTDGWSIGVATSFWMTVLTAGWSVGVATSFYMTVDRWLNHWCCYVILNDRVHWWLKRWCLSAFSLRGLTRRTPADQTMTSGQMCGVWAFLWSVEF